MRNHATRLASVAATFLATLGAAATATATTVPTPNHTLETLRAVIEHTDHAPIIKAQSLGSQTVYASFSDRRTRIAATYLQGKLVQGTLDTILYAANGACFRQQRLPSFVGLSRIAPSLLPLPSAKQRIRYTISGHRLSWREPATRQHSVERGVVEFDAHDRITASRTASYTYGHTQAAAQELRLSYPTKLPRSVPASLPKPACKSA